MEANEVKYTSQDDQRSIPEGTAWVPLCRGHGKEESWSAESLKTSEHAVLWVKQRPEKAFKDLYFHPKNKQSPVEGAMEGSFSYGILTAIMLMASMHG